MAVERSAPGAPSDPASLSLEFPAGLPAFEQETRFVLLTPPETAPLVFLQSERTPSLCFIAIPVDQLVPDYELCLTADDLALCGFETGRLPDPEEILVIALLTCMGEETTANLLAPVVVHRALHRAVQAVRPDRLYSHRHPIQLASLEAGAC